MKQKGRSRDVPNMEIRGFVAGRLAEIIKETYGSLDFKAVANNIVSGGVSSSYLARIVKKQSNAISIDRLDYVVRAVGHKSVKTIGDFFNPLGSPVNVQARHRDIIRTINELLENDEKRTGVEAIINILKKN